MPLVAVSQAFEQMTGYSCEEIVGLNCRFLNYDCEMNSSQRFELRSCCRTGKPFTGLLQNQRKNGEMFLNLLDLRGLTVARDAETGEDIWYLVGIQSDVTGLAKDGLDGEATAQVKEAHAQELKALAVHLRQELQKEFAQVAFATQLSAQSDAEGCIDAALQEECGGMSVPEGGSVAIPALPGIERGPKPAKLPMIALLPEADWVKYDSEDDSSEPEQVHKRSKIELFPSGGVQVRAVKSFWCTWSHFPVFSSIVLGTTFALLCQFYDRHRKKA
jgi:PAS domain S-box-containing protein